LASEDGYFIHPEDAELIQCARQAGVNSQENLIAMLDKSERRIEEGMNAHGCSIRVAVERQF
jgi:hypothetical protein